MTTPLPLTRDDLRNLLRRREEILVAEERAAVRATLDEETPTARKRLREMLGKRVC